MPYRVRYDDALGLVVVTPDGDCDLACALAMQSAAAAMAQERGVTGILLDVRGISYTPSFGDIQTLAGHAARALAGRRIAVVVAGPLHAGVARQFTAYAGMDGATAEVFADAGAAAEWLNGSGACAPA